MTISMKNVSEPFLAFVYEKQLEFKKEKRHVVSLGYTIERLIKDAYLGEEQKKMPLTEKKGA